MTDARLSFKGFEMICRHIGSVCLLLGDIEKGHDFVPMKYSARLSWESLYEVRKILCVLERPGSEQQSRSFSSGFVIGFENEDLLNFQQLINDIMSQVQQIEVSRDMAVMQALAQECRHKLAGCPFIQLPQTLGLTVAKL